MNPTDKELQNFNPSNYTSQNLDNKPTKSNQKDNSSKLIGRNVVQGEANNDSNIDKIYSSVLQDGPSKDTQTNNTSSSLCEKAVNLADDENSTTNNTNLISIKTDTLSKDVINCTNTKSSNTSGFPCEEVLNLSTGEVTSIPPENKPKLSLEQILEKFKFLKTNVDSKKIADCQVIIIGEIHDEETSVQSQEQLISHLWINDKCTLLTEIGREHTRLFSNCQEYDQNSVDNIKNTIQSWDDPSVKNALVNKFIKQMDSIFITGKLLFKIINKCAVEVPQDCNFTLSDVLDTTTLESLKQKFKDIGIEQEFKKIQSTITDTIAEKRNLSENNIALLQQKLNNNEISPQVFIELQTHLDQILTGKIKLNDDEIRRIIQKLENTHTDGISKFNSCLQDIYDSLDIELDGKISQLFPVINDFVKKFALSKDELSCPVDFSILNTSYSSRNSKIKEIILDFIKKNAITAQNLETYLPALIKEIKYKLLFESAQVSAQNALGFLNKCISHIEDSSSFKQLIHQSIMHDALSTVFSTWQTEQQQVNDAFVRKAVKSIKPRNESMAEKIVDQINNGKALVFVTAGNKHVDKSQGPDDEAIKDLYNKLKEHNITYYAISAKTADELTDNVNITNTQNDNNEESIDSDTLENNPDPYAQQVQSVQEQYTQILNELFQNDGLPIDKLQQLYLSLEPLSEECLSKLNIDLKELLKNIKK